MIDATQLREAGDKDPKTCSFCGELKPITEFHRSANSSGGRRADCKLCTMDRNGARSRAYMRTLLALRANHPAEFEALYARLKAGAK